MKKSALIVAGGKGKRMKTSISKQFLILDKLPVLMHTINKFSKFDQIVLSLPKSKFNYWSSLCKNYNFKQNHKLVEGGDNRFNSVKNGLAEIDDNSIVLIHDGVRPLVSERLIDKLIKSAEEEIGIVPVLPCKNSIRKINGNSSKSIPRHNLYQVQTPQCFFSKDIKESYSQGFSTIFTDDASVFESAGKKIKTIEGEVQNIKITNPKDLEIAEIFMR